jgi:outer membrane biogenesis lipoprotein LolB
MTTRNVVRGTVVATFAAALLGACNLTGESGLVEDTKTYPGWESTKTILDLSGSTLQTYGSFTPQADALEEDNEEITSYDEDADRMFFRTLSSGASTP